jgi:hypothetical protein
VRGRSLVTLVALAIAFAALAPSAGAATAQQAIGALNAQRAAAGIPAGIVENPDWSRGCAQHMEYVRQNGDGDGHDEVPGKPGFTPEGQEAARSSVLGGTFGDDGTNGWEDAPIHLAQLLGPGLSVTGYADGCMWTWPGYQRPEPPTTQVFNYPGQGAEIYSSVDTSGESPMSPADAVGVPNLTGTHLYLFAFGGGVTSVDLTGATLTGPDGPVSVRLVDNLTPDIGQFLPPGGIVVPTEKLRPKSDYTAGVTGQADSGAPLSWNWSFRTKSDPERERACAKARASVKSATKAYSKAKARYRKNRSARNSAAVKRARTKLTRARRSVTQFCD